METITPLLRTLTPILAALALIAAVEALVPLRRGPWYRRHRATNLALTALTLGINLVASAALAALLALGEREGFGPLRHLARAPIAGVVVGVLALDLSFYASHVAMHRVSCLWRFHAVHHSDPAVDVTTSLRQHPAETLIRYAFLAAVAIPLGVGVGAFALYRALSVACALLEHANVRVPSRLDAVLSLVFTWPGFHKVHHSRDVRLTDSNYGNLVSWWDRLFSSFTPVRLGESVDYGLRGFDALQGTVALLMTPFRWNLEVEVRRDAGVADAPLVELAVRRAAGEEGGQ